MKHLFSHFNPPATSAIELTNSSVSNVDVINSIAPTTLPGTSLSNRPFSTLKEKSSSLLWQHLSNG